MEEELIDTEINFDFGPEGTNTITIHRQGSSHFRPEENPKNFEDGFAATATLSKEQIQYYKTHKILKGMLRICKICFK